MRIHIRARLATDRVDEDGNFAALTGVRVALRDLIGELASTITVTGEAGGFDLFYKRGVPQRRLTLVVTDNVGRVLPISSFHHVAEDNLPGRSIDELGRVVFNDIDGDDIVVGDFIIREADARGLAVTLGTGEVRGLSHGNAVTVLVDKDVFTHAATRFREAEESILVSQLTFSLPPNFRPDATAEITKVIFGFSTPVPDAAHPRAAGSGAGDARPERLLLLAADFGVDVRILLHKYYVPLVLKILAGVIIFPFAGTDGLFEVLSIIDDHTSVDEAKSYFVRAGRSNIKAQAFEQSLTNFGAMHARLAIVDAEHAICMGASFAQSYVDTHEHLIDAPVRGGSDGLPNHDVGIGITGPAAADLHQTMSLLWKTAAPSDPFPALSHTPASQTSGGDGICSVQIVRTLSEDRFADPKQGEAGILEAYQRAIASAEDVIYLENQYFTNERIADALVRAMIAKLHLQVIVVLNIRPDIPTYPFFQRRLITRIRRKVGETPENPQRFGVFTRWTHESTGQPGSRMLPIYVHSKVGIVDDKWATIGSANLDGVSLDRSVFWKFSADQRAIEVNALLFKDALGTTPCEVVDLLRRKLWAEHLGFSLAGDGPNPEAQELKDRPSTGWLTLWNERAGAGLLHLRNTPSAPLTDAMARVLPWPPDNTTHKAPRDHLNALKIRTAFGPGGPGRALPLKSTRAFDFETGEWKERSKAKPDF